MYKIIGADHREYGPVSAERIQQWILEGRANAQSRIQPEDGDWRPLGDIPEFGDVLKAQAAAAPPPPRIASTEADRMASAIIARDYRVDIGDWFSRSWRLLQEDFWLLMGATGVILILSFGVASLPAIGPAAIVPLSFVLLGSLCWLFLKRIRGLSADMGDAFAGFTMAFVPLILGGLVAGVLTLAGLALCIVPGIYLIVIWWGFVPLLIIDKRLDFWPAMELSRKVVHQHWWQVAALVLCVVAVGLSGLLVFLVGVLLTMPLAVAVLVFAYQDIFGKLDPVTYALPAPGSAPVGGGNASIQAVAGPSGEVTAPVVESVSSVAKPPQLDGTPAAGKAPDA